LSLTKRGADKNPTRRNDDSRDDESSCLAVEPVRNLNEAADVVDGKAPTPSASLGDVSLEMDKPKLVADDLGHTENLVMVGKLLTIRIPALLDYRS